jgi:HSP20 family protein
LSRQSSKSDGGSFSFPLRLKALPLDRALERFRFFPEDVKITPENREVAHMALTKEPFRELMALQDRMNRLFTGNFVRDGSEEDLESASWTPPVDIYETKDDIVVNVEVPGMSKDLISVEVKDDVLVIQGERPFEKDVDKEQYHRIERSYGKFKRSFLLGVPVQVDGIQAGYRDGILEITLPKVEAVKPRKIEISE